MIFIAKTSYRVYYPATTTGYVVQLSNFTKCTGPLKSFFLLCFTLKILFCEFVVSNIKNQDKYIVKKGHLRFVKFLN